MFLSKKDYKRISRLEDSSSESPKISPVISPSALTKKDLVTNPDGSQVDVDDNTLLTVLDKQHILANMRNRFNRDCIYTFTASVLLAVNPWKQIANLYSEQMQMLYTNKSLHSLPPHPYAIADTAYRYFQGDGKSQVLVVSGESGSGKTETAKTVISFLASHRERRLVHAGQREKSDEPAVAGVHDRVLSATPIMEAFGNASTIRNKNSSRFGKYHRLLYDRAGTLSGAEILPLLLEASRVTGISAHERNFHVFYLMLAGMSPDQLFAKYGITSTDLLPTVANGLKSDATRHQEDKEKYAELVHAFSTVGFGESERDEIFAVVAGILVLSQLRFAEQDEETKDEEGKRTKLVEIVNEDVLDRAAELLGFNRTQLYKVLLNKTVKIANRTSAYAVARSLPQVEAARATLIRTVYKRLFDRIVDRINALVAGDASPTRRAGGNELHIGVLDIFGFENLEKNSFEQLCINLTNERLQQFFIRKVLESELKTYQSEGIQSAQHDVAKIPLPDCSETLSVIKGALELLDDHCIKLSRNMATDEEKYNQQVLRQFYNEKADSRLQAPKFEKPKRNADGKIAVRSKASEAFVIKHYAGDVLYTVAGWLEKNNERMSPEMECLVRDAQCPAGESESTIVSGGKLVHELADNEACSYGCEKFKSVRSKFVSELESLLSMLDKCAVHYVRCFNPNTAQRPGEFAQKYVEEQVVQCGTVELVSVMHHGFPNRQPLAQIAEKFQQMLPHDFRNLNARDLTSVIMNAFEIPPSEYAIGLTTLFLKADQVRLLEQLRGVGELPSERVLSTIRRQVIDKKFKRCIEAIKLVNWLPKLTKELRRKKLFSHAAKLAVVLAFIIPRTKPWLATARETIRVRREEEERLARIKAEEEARLKAEEEERLRVEEEARLKAEEEERIRVEDEQRIRAEEEEKLRLEEVGRLRVQEEARLRAEEEERVRLEAEASLRAEAEAGANEERIRTEEAERVKAEEQARREAARAKPAAVFKPAPTTQDAYDSDNPLALISGKTRSVVPPVHGKENATQLNLPQGQYLGKKSINLTGNSLAKLPQVTAMMVNSISLFSIPYLNALMIHDGRRVMPVTTASDVADARSRRSSIGSLLPALLPVGVRGANISAIAQHPSRPDVFATAEADEVGAVTIWRATKGVESRFRIHLGNNNASAQNQSTQILKLCFIAPDNPETTSPVLNPNSHLLAVLVECGNLENAAAQYLIIVEVGIQTSRKNSFSGSGKLDTAGMQFRVHKVEPIPPSQFVSNINRKISFLKSSASGRIVAVGGKGLLMFFAVGIDASGTLQVDLLAEQGYFPQIQTATFLSFISLFQVDPSIPADPEDYQEEQLLVSSADGNMLRFPILLNQKTCALDISGCGRVKECMATLAGKRLTALVKKSDEAFYSVTADGCIDHWLWVDRRPFRDHEASIALVSEQSKAMFSIAAMLSKEVVCFDASAGKVVAFDPSDPDSLNPRLLYQFNSQGVL